MVGRAVIRAVLIVVAVAIIPAAGMAIIMAVAGIGTTPTRHR